MDISFLDGVPQIRLDVFFILGIACLCYFLGRWIKSKITLLQDLCIPVPFIGGFPAALAFSLLKVFGVANVILNPELNSLIFRFFLTMIALFASRVLIKKGILISVLFWALAMVLASIQAIVGIVLCEAMDIHQHLGLLVGTVSMIGGYDTISNFIPIINLLDKASGATENAMGLVTLGMVSSMLVGAPLGVYLIKRYDLKNPNRTEFDNNRLIRSIQRSDKPFYQTHTVECLKIVAIAFVCMALGDWFNQTFIKETPLPDYVSCMIFALLIRNIADATEWFSVDGLALRTLTKLFLILFILVSTCALQLDLILTLSAPVVFIYLICLLINILFARFVYFTCLGKNFRAMLITVGGMGFSMGVAGNGLSNMQSLCEKYGPNTDGFLVLSIVGLVLLNISNAFLLHFLLGSL